MEAFYLKNFRSLNDTGFISLKKINILVGQNSSGKSSFLRAFLLLKQSISRNPRGPILWYDESLVDFGNYDDTKSKNSANEEGITFGFKIKPQNRGISYDPYNQILFNKDLIVNVFLEVYESPIISYIRKITLSFEDQNFEILLDEFGFAINYKVNERELLSDDIKIYIFKTKRISTLIPGFYIFDKDIKILGEDYYLSHCVDIAKKSIGHESIKLSTIREILMKLNVGSKNDILTLLKEKNTIIKWKKTLNEWDVTNETFSLINDYMIAYWTSGILEDLDLSITQYIDQCKYIAPIRAKASRYYRQQNLSVSEVDSFGDNLHMFLDNLTPEQLYDYQNFIFDVFNFKPKTESSKGHIKINIENSTGQTLNLTDLGFGYSQILPIITKLWYESSRYNSIDFIYPKNENENITILIEQPELHLHPAMQAQLADAFILALDNANKNSINLNLIIETHSSVIINRIGRRIYEDKLNPESINVCIFEPISDLNCKIRITEFNDKGILINWPIGFFEPKK